MTSDSLNWKPELRQKVRSLPDEPGVYQFKDERGKILYIGKASSLKKRVSQYFQASKPDSERIRRMVEGIRDLDVLLCKSEKEALILENSLIKKAKPPFNVQLRDDKNHLYLKITTSDPWPGLDLSRAPARDGDRYFGPFIPSSSARKTMRLLAKNFQLRVCLGAVKEQNYRACLYYQIHQCLAPCVDLVSQEEYRHAVEHAIQFLEGRDKELVGSLEEQMRKASVEERFERAAYYRDLIHMVQRIWDKQSVVSTAMEEQDAFGLHREGGKAALHVWNVRRGLVQGRREYFWDNLLDMPDEEFLAMAVEQYYSANEVVPREILLPFSLPGVDLLGSWLRERRGGTVEIHVPQRGKKRDRLQLVLGDAKLGFEKRFRWTAKPVEELQKALDLPRRPARIEAFDISNIQGSDIVASMVVFVDGKPRKSEYRKFKIKTVSDGPDDFASMAEVVGRRYRRVLKERRELPDLILIDGGRGQLSASQKSLAELGLEEQSIASLAKEEEVLFVPGRSEPVRIPRGEAALQLVQRIRDEAHRFAVTFHRQRRRRRTIASVLELAPGIGPKRRKALLKKFGSLKGILAASTEDLAGVVGPATAAQLAKFLRERDA